MGHTAEKDAARKSWLRQWGEEHCEGGEELAYRCTEYDREPFWEFSIWLDSTVLAHLFRRQSGECLCGSFAHPGEREEVSYWFPDVFEEIAELERLIADRDDIPETRRRWGWGADPVARAADRAGVPSATGLLCSSCDDRFQSALFEVPA